MADPLEGPCPTHVDVDLDPDAQCGPDRVALSGSPDQLETAGHRVLGRAALGALASLVLGRGFAYTLHFVSFAVIAGHLGPSGLGVYSFAVAFAVLFQVVTNFGFRPVLTRDVAQEPDREAVLVPNVAYMRFALGLLAYGLLAAVLQFGGYGGAISAAALVAGLMLLLLSVETFQTVLEVRLRTGWVALAEALKSCLMLVGSIALVAAGAGVTAFLWLYVATNALGFAIVLLRALKLGHFSWRPRLSVWRPVVVAAAPVGLAGLFIALYYRIDFPILARLHPPAEVGQYGAAFRVLEVLTVLPMLAGAVLRPVLARSVVEGPGVLQRRYVRIIHLVTIVSLPTAIAGAMTAPRVFPALPGFEQFAPAGVVLAILCPAAASIFLSSVVQSTLLAGHLERQLLRISAIGLVWKLLLDALLVPPFTYYGAALATTLTEALILPLSARSAHRRLGVRWPLGRLPRALPAAALLAVALVPGYLLGPFTQLALGLLVYVVAVVLTRALSWSDLEIFLSRGGPVALVTPPRPGGGLSAVLDLAGRIQERRAVRLVLGGPPLGHDGPPGVDVRTLGAFRPLPMWKALRGASVCQLETVGLVGPWWLPLVARLAGCARVLLVEERPQDIARRSSDTRRWIASLRDRLWLALLDEVVVSSVAARDALRAAAPRLASAGVTVVEEGPRPGDGSSTSRSGLPGSFESLYG